MNAHEQVEVHADPRLFGFAAGAGHQRLEPFEVGAGDEGGFAAGDDDTLGLRIG